jgi:hypothetical protein
LPRAARFFLNACLACPTPDCAVCRSVPDAAGGFSVFGGSILAGEPPAKTEGRAEQLPLSSSRDDLTPTLTERASRRSPALPRIFPRRKNSRPCPVERVRRSRPSIRISLSHILGQYHLCRGRAASSSATRCSASSGSRRPPRRRHRMVWGRSSTPVPVRPAIVKDGRGHPPEGSETPRRCSCVLPARPKPMPSARRSRP